MVNSVSDILDTIQDCLNYDNCRNEQFVGNGIGKIGTTGFILGMIGGIHTGILIIFLLFDVSMTSTSFWSIVMWSTYMSLLCIFHFAEFFTTAVNQPANLSYESFIVNHSKSYTVAALASWTEYWLEYIIFGQSKLRLSVSFFGIALVLFGQALRTVAMWQCGAHFSHLIIHERHSTHQLVTTGIYRYLRHPSYVGWFYWSIGTQLILCNPICTVAYAIASWAFFKDRIPYEENLLIKFYKEQYVEYARRTVVGIPFVHSPAAIAASGTSDITTEKSALIEKSTE